MNAYTLSNISSQDGKGGEKWIEIKDGDRVICRMPGWSERDQADAALFAAAPQMLAALAFIEKSYQTDFEIFPVAFQTAINLVEAAIAKAKGGAA